LKEIEFNKNEEILSIKKEFEIKKNEEIKNMEIKKSMEINLLKKMKIEI